MFTGIIEAMGIVSGIKEEGKNLRLTVRASFASGLKSDQSVSHNGACLTVTDVREKEYDVVVIDESLKKTNLGALKVGDKINLERSLKADSHLDGHIVQGHVDTVAEVKQIQEEEGSWLIRIEHPQSKGNITVEKGSICVNGVSLTVVNSDKNSFSVAVIPHTWENTNFHLLKPGDKVNIEFDIIGKYIARILSEK